MLHQLESRRLLSAEVGCTLQVFNVVGTDKPDLIEVALQASETRLSTDRLSAQRFLGPGTFVTVWKNGAQDFNGFFPQDTVTELNVFGLGGDDVLRVANVDSPIAVAIAGDDGNDEIYAFNMMSAAGFVVFGGSGDDVIWLGNGRENGGGHVAYGEAGDDVIHGSGMGDILYGDFDPNDPRDWVLSSGNDLIYGNGGDDVIFGGGGDDELYGNDGDDYLEGGAGFDLLAGGAGLDTGITDGLDKMTEIEQITHIK